MSIMVHLFPFAIFWTVVATIYDLRNKQIPNKIHLSAAGVGLLINYFIGWQAFVYSIIFMGIFTLTGFIISVSGGWGGADGKFLGALGTYFHPIPHFFLLALIPGTLLFKAYLVYTGKDPGDIPRDEWLEKGVPFFPVFLFAEFLLLIMSIL